MPRLKGKALKPRLIARKSIHVNFLFFFLSVDGIIAFAWEPNGSKFAVPHGEVPRISVSFYHVKNNGKIEFINKSGFVSPQSLDVVK